MKHKTKAGTPLFPIWTVQEPLQPGWYWYKDDNELPTIVKVRDTACGLFAEDHGTFLAFLVTARYSGARWSGPIQTPRDPKENQAC